MAGRKGKATAEAAPELAAEVRQQKYGMVSTAKLRQHPQNPNRGDVPALENSMRANGFYGTVVVQKSTGYVLAGNHRLLAARKAGMKTIPAVTVDVDDKTALRILLADNRVTRLGWDDPAILLEDLGLVDPFGTGYSDADIEALRESLNPPLPEDLDSRMGEYEVVTFTLHRTQASVVATAMTAVAEAGGAESEVNTNKRANALHTLCKAYLERSKS